MSASRDDELDLQAGLTRTRGAPGLTRRSFLRLFAASAGTAAIAACASPPPTPTQAPAPAAPAPASSPAAPASSPAAPAPAASPATAPLPSSSPPAASPSPASSPAAAPSNIRQAEELVVAFSADPGHLDPRVEAGGIGWSIFYHMFDSFIWRDEQTNPIPWLVERWEQVNPTTLRWNLRRGIKFHNGEDVTADAVKFTIEQYIAPDSRSPSKSQFIVVKDFKISDPYTIDLITEKPNRPLLRNITQAMAMSPRALRELGDKFSTNPVGTGMFKFVEYQPGSHILMEENPSYWNRQNQPAHFRRLRIRFIPEDGTRTAALEAGEVMMINNVPPDQLPRLRANPNLQVLVSPSYRVIFVTLRTDRKPFDDKRVRQAMNYAINREELTKDLLGGLAPIETAPIAKGVFGYNPNLPPYTYDPDKAKRLLAEAGASGATFNFGAPVGRYLLDKQVGEAVAGYLEAIGLKVSFENPPWSTFVSEVTKYENAKYDGYMFGWGVITGEPDQLMGEHFYSKNARRNLYKNPEVDQLLEEGATSFDEARVRAAYEKAEAIVWDDAPWIFLYEQPDVTAINKKLHWNAGRRDEFWLFHNAWLDT